MHIENSYKAHTRVRFVVMTCRADGSPNHKALRRTPINSFDRLLITAVFNVLDGTGTV